MTNVGDEHTLELRIRVTRIQEDMELMTAGMGGRQFPVKVGTRVSFILRDISDREITMPLSQFEGMVGE